MRGLNQEPDYPVKHCAIKPKQAGFITYATRKAKLLQLTSFKGLIFRMLSNTC